MVRIEGAVNVFLACLQSRRGGRQSVVASGAVPAGDHHPHTACLVTTPVHTPHYLLIAVLLLLTEKTGFISVRKDLISMTNSSTLMARCTNALVKYFY